MQMGMEFRNMKPWNSRNEPETSPERSFPGNSRMSQADWPNGNRSAHRTSCVSLSNLRIRCRVCEVHEDPEMFESNLPERCLGELFDEHPKWDAINDLGETDDAEELRSRRFRCYRIAADVCRVYGKVRRIWPTCITKRIEEQFGASKTGYKEMYAHRACSCRKQVKQAPEKAKASRGGRGIRGSLRGGRGRSI